MSREILVNAIYRHFRGNLYKVIAIGRHSETNEQLVVYQGLYEGHDIFVRPYAMFAEKLDKKRYPDTMQTYRFELVE